MSDVDVSVETYMTVIEAARKLGVSSRRVRTLLIQRRLLGKFIYHQGRQLWLVNHPFRLTLGTRGPKLGSWKSPIVAN